MTNTDMPNKVHEGKNVKRFREMLGMKQEGLAYELGDDWTQKKISLLEQKETIEPDILEQVAKVLKVTPEAIQKFNEEAAINVIANTFNSNDSSTLNAINYYCSSNPIDKVVELYERLLASEKEKVELLQGKPKN
ncbi:helix-turn-helix transcriptional regulator [[Flexibacter] sp. ATCC 35208]|uniref:helix-turn-helix domain-containing protein n=1 Tax=[Flexibacter] sp. ATCC 35208 TaxID=1936242 RepID=UPI0009C8A8DB|nr:helix-turn-helix transcriptional regulator [[Flexibacter] sp. ATCC 35208]OMP75751.1 transcriptional regulator [[Flexibacter] sp. ATCC 35208]